MSFGYPLWTVHQCFTSSHNTFTQWPELTYGKSYFSVPKAAHVGRHGHGRVFEERAMAFVFEAQCADRLVY
ncbi:DUF2083 domain-containing protein [Rhizobium laguerreae]|nr:DUF2083 domain-containing protein [Rhizobium laguerreae]